MKRLFFVISGIMLVTAILFVGCAKATQAPALTLTQNNTQLPSASNITQGIQVGSTAPNFQLQSLDGKTVSLNDFRDKPVMLTFWATWCPFCRSELPIIQKEYNELQNKGFIVLTVDIIDSRPAETTSNLASFMKTNNYSFPVLLDNKMQVTKDYNVKQTPTSFLIGKDGVVREVITGVFSKSAVDASLNQLLFK